MAYASTVLTGSEIRIPRLARPKVGMVAPGDMVLALSHSGESDEILAILPALKRLAIPLVALTGNLRSTLAQHSDGAAHRAAPGPA